jgi:hypothetical protein
VRKTTIKDIENSPHVEDGWSYCSLDGLSLIYDELLCAVSQLRAGFSDPRTAQLELVRLRRWEEIAQLACGLWLSASPFILHYAHQDHLRFWHWALGAIVSVLALFELWQDWNRPDIAGHGR